MEEFENALNGLRLITARAPKNATLISDTLSKKTIDAAIKALGKQIPKKTEWRLKDYMDYWSCPNCGKSYWELEYIRNYCSNCGQRLEIEE